MTFEILLLILLTLASAFCSGSETALFSLSPMRQANYRTDPNPQKRLIATLLSHPRDLLITIFILNTLVNILLQNAASHLVGDLAGWTLKVGLPFFLMLFLGEIIPKILSMENNIKVAELVAGPIAACHRLLTPIRLATLALTAPLSHALFFFLKKEEPLTHEELHQLVIVSKEQGLLHNDEMRLLEGLLKFQESPVREVMSPKANILAYDFETAVSDLLPLFTVHGCSRVPVFKDNLDNILGILTAEAFFAHQSTIKKGKELLPLLKPVFYIPETTPCRSALRQLETRGREMALIVNEYGTLSGLITRKDLIAIVIGKIEDIKDQTTHYTRMSPLEIIASGNMELAQLNTLFNTNLESQHQMMTVGGWLVEQLGDIPKSGREFNFSPLFFQVLEADAKHISRLYIRKRER